MTRRHLGNLNLLGRLGKFVGLAAGLALWASCAAGEDQAPPILIDSEFYPSDELGALFDSELTTIPATVHLGTVNPADAIDPAGAPIEVGGEETPTSGVISVIFNELLKADSVQAVVRDAEATTGEPENDDVDDLIGRAGIVELVGLDGTAHPAAFQYWPSILRDVEEGEFQVQRVFLVSVDDFLPARSEFHLRIIANKIEDTAGNLMPAAVYVETNAEGYEQEMGPVTDALGRGIAGVIPLVTVGVDLTGVHIADYGAVDDPETEEEDESIPYTVSCRDPETKNPIAYGDSESPTTDCIGLSFVHFNTGVHPESAQGLISFDEVGGGSIEAVIGGGGGRTLWFYPSSPLAANAKYELRVMPGIADNHGVKMGGNPSLYTFDTILPGDDE